jgi:guanylate kinase
MPTTKGLIIVVSAPSGAGKSTLCSYLGKRLPRLRYSISYTTRPMRRGEKDGIDYHFVSESVFRKMVRQKAFVEWAKVHDHYYGTPRKGLEKIINAGDDAILDIDVQGGALIRKIFPKAVLVFIMTPTLADLEARLRARNKDSEEVIRSFLPGWTRENGNQVSLAFECASPAEVDEVYARVVAAGFEGEKEPWDAFWGQRYALLGDPDGVRVNLYAAL